LFGVIEELYGFRTVRDDASVWHEDVRFYRLTDRTGTTVGRFYLDLYAREGKRGGAWMDSCRNRRVMGSGMQTPAVLLTCNFGRGVDGKPALFDHGDVIVLFHEMGHGLHQLLTEVDEPDVAGLNGVEWDAIELPSQFMENFCWEWPRITAMSAHVDTGEPLPRALYERMLAARNFQSGTVTMRQIEFSLFDMLLHSSFDPERQSLQTLVERVREEAAVHLVPAYNRFAHGFTHIFSGGYAAGYYSYKWAEVMSADAYAALEEAPDKARWVGERFRRNVLAVGGSRPALDNFKAFRGRAPHIDALLRHLGMAG
jgi:oligopeptidase A